MGGIGSKQHEELLLKTRNDFIERGWRVIRLEGKSPDAIAAKMDNGKLKIIAIEILGKTYKEDKGWTNSWTHNQKHNNYHMFDSVIIKTFKRNKPPYHKRGEISTGTLQKE